MEIPAIDRDLLRWVFLLARTDGYHKISRLSIADIFDEVLVSRHADANIAGDHPPADAIGHKFHGTLTYKPQLIVDMSSNGLMRSAGSLCCLVHLQPYISRLQHTGEV